MRNLNQITDDFIEKIVMDKRTKNQRELKLQMFRKIFGKVGSRRNSSREDLSKLPRVRSVHVSNLVQIASNLTSVRILKFLSVLK